MATGWPTGSDHAGLGRIGIVTGLRAEARIARRLGAKVAIGGGTAEGARRAVLALVEQGVTALISFGLAGALDPALASGALIVPEAVFAGHTRLATDPALSRALGGPTTRCLLGAEAAAATPAEKHRLWRETGCVAIDLESGVLAGVAGEFGLRFAVLRAVCDPADVSLPPAAMVALSSDGRIRPAHVLASVAREPGQIVALMRLARAAALARRTLARQVRMVRGQRLAPSSSP